MLLRDGSINAMKMRNRFIAGPMERSMAHRDGRLSETYIDYLEERAKGGVALSIIESTYVDTRGMGNVFQVGMHDDHVIPALRRAASAVHAAGGKLGTELYFGGRVTSSLTSQRQPMGPSEVPCEILDPRPIPRAMDQSDIDEMIGKFAAAAGRAVEAGLDMVHLHGAHGYLLCAFLSPFSNKRDDAYGGSLSNRARFPLELIAAVRSAVGPDYPIGYRLSADEYVDGGLTIDETVEFSKLLVEAGIDLIDVSGGIYESLSMLLQGPEAPKGGFVRNAQLIKSAVGDGAAVSVAQRLNDPNLANEVLRSGIDFITLSRAFHADPYYVRRLEEDRPQDIIPCIACYHCSSLLMLSEHVRCASNPVTGLERHRRFPRAPIPRCVTVVGGGPAGMQAARLLATQGHNVSLHERERSLGGQMRHSARIAPDYAALVDYLARQLHELRVDVRLGSTVDAASLVADPVDAIVLATGASGGDWYCPVIGSPHTFDLFGALERDDGEWDERVVIVGGDAESCYLATLVAGHGGEVHIVEPDRSFALNKAAAGRGPLLERLHRLPTVHLQPESTVEEVGEGYVVVQSKGSAVRLDDVDTVVIGGRVSRNDLTEELGALAPELELYPIGDGVKPRDMYVASHEAADAAQLISLRASAPARVETQGRR